MGGASFGHFTYRKFRRGLAVRVFDRTVQSRIWPPLLGIRTAATSHFVQLVFTRNEEEFSAPGWSHHWCSHCRGLSHFSGAVIDDPLCCRDWSGRRCGSLSSRGFHRADSLRGQVNCVDDYSSRGHSRPASLRDDGQGFREGCFASVDSGLRE